MNGKNLPSFGSVLNGDCIDIMKSMPNDSVDVIFADPPYNLQLNNELLRPDNTVVNAVDDSWDKFESIQEYEEFTKKWMIQSWICYARYWVLDFK